MNQKALSPCITAVLVSLFVTGCAHQVAKPTSISSADHVRIAQDTAAAIEVIWPSNQTQFRTEPTKDRNEFADVLARTLRQSGYGVAPMEGRLGKPLICSLDQPDPGWVRVSVNIEGQRLSRIYQNTARGLQPASAWSRQE